MSKNKGFLIFELFLSFMLASILLITIYQAYQTIQKTVQYIEINSHFEIEKSLAHYHITLDSMQIVTPPQLDRLYEQITIYQSNTNEKEKKKIDKEFKDASFFFPTIIESTDKKIISWITKRKLLYKNGIYTKVSYIFKKEANQYKEKNIYSLSRQESIYNSNYEIIKEGIPYVIIKYIFEPIITVTLSELEEKNNKNESDLNSAEKQSNKEDLYIKWIKNKKFIKQNQLNIPEMKTIIKQSFMPYNINITGAIASADLNKEIDFNYSFGFPSSDYILEQTCHKKENPKNNLPPSKPHKIPQEKENPIENTNANIKINIENTGIQ